jgi:SAM-dependent methyltransferase/RimJ/RimL family protein N-acetyltransferase
VTDPAAQRPEVILDPTYGYRRLEPLPTKSELERFYESQYYDLLRKGGRVPDLRRLLSGGQEAERERSWLRETLYADITAALAEHGSGRRVLDVGCGQGELLLWLGEQGFEPHGIDPAADAVALARERGLDAHTATLEELLEDPAVLEAYDAVLLLNVLEHVPDAVGMLRGIRRLLAPGGLLYIRVPNDFNPLQLSAQAKLGVEPWWIVLPDHVNYFDVDSLCALSRRLGFEPVDVQADFPMELFLLMGLNYVGDPDVGATCHAYRVEAERSMTSDGRRALFRSLAAAGLGRNSRLLARKVAEKDRPEDGLPTQRDGYSYLPLRRSDIQALRRFRNEQMDVLRQSETISPEQQERWFDEVVVPAQRDPRPPMVLASILEDGAFIGYGGLTNISWDSRRAEVSFLVDPARAADEVVYRRDMEAFLRVLTELAFDHLGLNRLFAETYAFRDLTIAILEEAGFTREGRLRQHVAIPGSLGDSIVLGLLAREQP